MGDKNQAVYFMTHKLDKSEGPILEVGSAVENHALPYKMLCNKAGDEEYVGVDMVDGEGVDVVQDLCEGRGHMASDYFRFVICASVLEHVKRPWLMAKTITDVMRPRGLLFLSAPWVWRYHAYPHDYFRYSPSSFDALFPDFVWDRFAISGRIPGDIVELNMNKLIDFDTRFTKHGELPFMMINAIGVKKDD